MDDRPEIWGMGRVGRARLKEGPGSWVGDQERVIIALGSLDIWWTVLQIL